MKRYLTSLCRSKGLKLKMTELDILRSCKHDLSVAQRRAYYLQKVRRGGCDTILTPALRDFLSGPLGKSRRAPPLSSSSLSLWLPLPVGLR